MVMSISVPHQDKLIKILLAFALLLNILFWFSVRDIDARWTNVPPPPNEKYASLYGLGDSSFSYRINSLMLQNLGDTGGRVTALEDYNYETLAQWFYLQDRLDPVSNFIPYLASYYFGSVQTPEVLSPVLDYLVDIGKRPYGEKWRWLAHGVFLARFEMKDIDKALEMANILSNVENDDIPGWARHMPAFILNAKGEKEAAYALFLEILKSSSDKMHPNEVNATKSYICTRILSKQEAVQNPICKNIY